MYAITHGSTQELPDVAAFIDLLNQLQAHPLAELRQLFDPEAEVVVTRAPGRLDLMGGIADYSGSLVLPLPLKEATLVALQRSAEPTLKIISLPTGDDDERDILFEMALADFEQAGQPIDYATAQAYFAQHPRREWAAYVAGVFLVLMRECGAVFTQGVRILIDSQVPEGRGVSSSAALEAAVMQAVTVAFNLTLEPRDLALLCQRVENLIVGAPCGIMDQMNAIIGQPEHLLAILCQPAELQGSIPLPADLAVWGLDSGVRHSVSGADYISVRVGAFMGYRLIAEQAGLKVEPTPANLPAKIIDDRWGGYLANLTPSEFEQFFAAQLPEHFPGDEFLAQYGLTSDPVTSINPIHLYTVRAPTVHPIYEHFRVRTFANLLRLPVTEERLSLLGELMIQSHLSYSACGLGSNGTDLLVKLVQAAGPRQGLYGAKITGGGSGGTIAVLGHHQAGPAVAAVAQQYAQRTGHQPYIFAGSSPGAAAFGHLVLTPAQP